jgi:hypothetical protein
MALPGNEHVRDYDPISFGSGRDGYSFTGQFVEVLKAQTKHGECSVFIFNGETAKPRILWGYHVDLRRKWDAAAPQRGDTVTVTRAEEAVPIEGGRHWYEYSLVTAPPEEPEPATSQLGPDDPRPAEMF